MRFLLFFFIFLFFTLYAETLIPKNSQQLIIVEAKDFNTSLAHLQAYEKINGTWEKQGKAINVNLGRNGLGWGEGIISFKALLHEPFKKEGDGKSPAGLFTLDSFFGYEKQTFNFPYLQVQAQDLCIDESESSDYNTLVSSPAPQDYKSFEYMRREDNLYKLGIFVGHNKKQIKNRGSCIFLHIQREAKSPTSGCTSMPEKELLNLMKWLDKSKKPLLLQLPSLHLKKLKLFNDYK